MTFSVSRFAPIVAVMVLVLCHAASAEAGPVRPDSEAPVGASASWLPAEDWVMQRWIPFDERALTSRLGMPSEDIAAALDRSGVSLQTLARRRGVRVQGLAGRLLASRQLPQGSPLWATLLARTRRMLTQSHLTVHMLRHVFHTWTVTRDTQAIFGVGQGRFDALYFDQHRSMEEIAAEGGVGDATLKRRALAAAEHAGRMGVAAGVLSTRENRVLRARDRRLFRGWALYRVPVTAVTARVGGRAFLCHLASS
jgi:lambda repressor-like predicted transcriptional regulator